MAMNELRKEVEAAAMAELNRANAKFPLFNSTHEGYAVILEEAEEAQEAMENVKTSLAVLWDRVKGIEVACFLDEDTTPTAIFHQAIDAACEMVQTAAMLLKYKVNVDYLLETIQAAVTVTLTNITTGTVQTAAITESGIGFYITEAGDYTLETNMESVMVTPKRLSIDYMDLMHTTTVSLREGTNMAYIGNYMGTYLLKESEV